MSRGGGRSHDFGLIAEGICLFQTWRGSGQSPAYRETSRTEIELTVESS